MLMPRTQSMSMIFLITMLVSCTSAQNYNPSNLDEKKQIYDTRGFLLPQCVAQKEGVPLIVIPLLTALAEKGIDTGLSLIGKWIEKRKEEHKAAYSTRAASYFFVKTNNNSLKPAVGCVVIARGWFGPPMEGTQSPGKNSWSSDQLTLLGLAKSPEFYLEAQVDYAADRKGFRLQPRRLDFIKPMAIRGEKKDIEVTFTLESTNPTVVEARAKSFASGIIVFKNVEPGTSLRSNALKGMTTHWMPLPGIKEEDFNQISNEDEFEPFSVLITIREESDAGDLLLAASTIFEASKDELKQLLMELAKKQINKSEANGNNTQESKMQSGN